MDILQAIEARHSVRAYLDKKIEGETLAALQNKIKELNAESGLNIQLALNEEKAFGGLMAHYGKFGNVKNYFAMVGDKNAAEKIGYFGEKLVLFAQMLGLNTCWVALTYSKVKSAYTVKKGEKLHVVIACGYGETQGKQHKSKPAQAVSNIAENSPEWFKNGVTAALLAPTALNQQKFYFSLCGDKVEAETKFGACTKIDLGIAKYHFEIGANKKIFDL